MQIYIDPEYYKAILAKNGIRSAVLLGKAKMELNHNKVEIFFEDGGMFEIEFTSTELASAFYNNTIILGKESYGEAKYPANLR